MSSFKRRTTSKQAPTPVGTRISPGAPSSFITSTGIPSLDDILGGGLPLSCSMLILAPDPHSAYGELVQKYFVAQGLASGQKLCIVDEDVDEFLAECMWMPGSAASGSALPTSVTDEEEGEERVVEEDVKIKIAWRYEQMKQFQTTVPVSNQLNEDYCRVFDLACRIPNDLVRTAKASGQIISVSVGDSPCSSVLEALRKTLGDGSENSDPPAPLRICIPCLGSSGWGDLAPHDICRFLLSLRNLLRLHPKTCASISLPPHLCVDGWAGPGWVQKLGWLTDASITLAAFTADPSLTALFPSHNGMVHIHSLPAPTTLVPLSDKFSSLRGLCSSGENNLAFKCMRKRMVFETLHLDLEGGVGERRTTPSTSATAMGEATSGPPSHAHPPSHETGKPAAGAAVQVELEEVKVLGPVVTSVEQTEVQTASPPTTKAKTKKRVGFVSDRPDLYDF